MAFGFKNDKNKASIRTVTLTGTRPNTQAGELDFEFPIDSDEIVLALAFRGQEDYRWHYISDYDSFEGEYAYDTAKILRAYHSEVANKFYVTCYVTGTMPAENPSLTIKAVLMKID